jgi:ABC-type Fe3+/spermidine/putrescine transport system ATPase subunit
MDAAKLVQVGTPAEIYEDPRTGFVAGFIGESNFFEGRVGESTAEGWTVRRSDGRSFAIPDHGGIAAGRPVRIAVRPEWMDLFRPGEVPAGENALAGTVRDVVYLGETIHVVVDITDGEEVRVAVRNEGQLARPLPWNAGDKVAVGWLPADCQLLEEPGP